MQEILCQTRIGKVMAHLSPTPSKSSDVVGPKNPPKHGDGSAQSAVRAPCTQLPAPSNKHPRPNDGGGIADKNGLCTPDGTNAKRCKIAGESSSSMDQVHPIVPGKLWFAIHGELA
jgi:hypothetical protein